MKWIKLILQIAEWLLPGNAGKGKLVEELAVAKEAIDVLSQNLPAKEKGRAIEKAVGNLKVVKGYKERVAKKLDKAKDRFWKKIFGD